jgi:hypothetical protein
MKKRLAPKILTALVVVALIVLAAPVLIAGDYHYGSSLVCQECHVMHFSQSHGYNPNGGGITTPLSLTGPHEYLLRNEVNALCLACHDGAGAYPDVLEDPSITIVRQGGALNQDGASPYFIQTGHTLDSTDVAMGSDPPWSNSDGFNCTDCHEPHGDPDGAVDVSGSPIYNVYRNLRTDAGNADVETPTLSDLVNVSYAYTTNDFAKDVFETGPALYDVSNVFFNEPVSTKSAMAEWCKKCHTNFHGAKGGDEVGGTGGIQWLRHPSADADIGAQGGTHSDNAIYADKTNKVKVMDPDDGIAPDGSGDETPFCLSCHKAHGNQNAFGLIYMSGEGAVTEEGDDGTQEAHLCHQCHGQGVPPTP